jgi:hypothetical protein
MKEWENNEEGEVYLLTGSRIMKAKNKGIRTRGELVLSRNENVLEEKGEEYRVRK